MAFSSSLAGAPLAVFSITEQRIAQARESQHLVSVSVDDPVYKRRQEYQGIWLLDVLKNLQFDRYPESETYVRFRCKDGYAPTVPLTRALKVNALIALRDKRAPQGKDWEQLPGSNAPSTPAPSYLVWVAPPGNTEEFPWPYQMVAIELVSSSEAFPGLPSGTAKAGQELFVSHCSKCHSINGVGGTLGPELNSPCSVTEYWNPRLLRQFITNAGSVRNGTKMPNFDSLPDKDIQLLLDYLHTMARDKMPGASCP